MRQFVLGLAIIALAVSPPSGSATFALGDYTVHAKAVDYNMKSGDFSVPNKVYLTKADGDITADRANGNGNTNIATLFGHVIVHDTSGNFGGLSSAKKASSRGPSTLTTDKLQINGKTKTYIATGNVHFTQADSDVTSDHAVLDDLTHTLTLDGNVKMSGNGRNLVADHVVYNTISGQAHATGNVILQFASNVHPIATPKPIVIKNPLQKTKSPP